MVKRNRSMTSAGNAQQLVEDENQDRFQKTADIAMPKTIAQDDNNFDLAKAPAAKRPMSSRKTAQITCTMDQSDRDYLKKLAIRLSLESEDLVTISGAIRHLIENDRKLN